MRKILNINHDWIFVKGMKEVPATIRLAHYQHDQYFCDPCDERCQASKQIRQ